MNDERPGGPIRIGDSEREDAVKRLGEHYEAGRLSAEEHTERIGAALQAKTDADLAALFSDLPGAQQASGPKADGPKDRRTGPGPFGGQRPEWAARGPFGKLPVPLLIALGGGRSAGVDRVRGGRRTSAGAADRADRGRGDHHPQAPAWSGGHEGRLPGGRRQLIAVAVVLQVASIALAGFTIAKDADDGAIDRGGLQQLRAERTTASPGR